MAGCVDLRRSRSARIVYGYRTWDCDSHGSLFENLRDVEPVVHHLRPGLPEQLSTSVLKRWCKMSPIQFCGILPLKNENVSFRITYSSTSCYTKLPRFKLLMNFSISISEIIWKTTIVFAAWTEEKYRILHHTHVMYWMLCVLKILWFVYVNNFWTTHVLVKKNIRIETSFRCTAHWHIHSAFITI